MTITGSSAMRNSVRIVGRVRRIDRSLKTYHKGHKVHEGREKRSMLDQKAPPSWPFVSFVSFVVLLLPLLAVKCRVYLRCEFAAHAFHARQFVDTCRGNPAETAEMAQQRAAPLRADAGDFLEPALFARFFAALAMSGDRKAVRLVAHTLDQVQRGRFRARPQRLAVVAADQRLMAGAAFGALRNADDEHAADAEIREHLERL